MSRLGTYKLYIGCNITAMDQCNSVYTTLLWSVGFRHRLYRHRPNSGDRCMCLKLATHNVKSQRLVWNIHLASFWSILILWGYKPHQIIVNHCSWMDCINKEHQSMFRVTRNTYVRFVPSFDVRRVLWYLLNWTIHSLSQPSRYRLRKARTVSQPFCNVQTVKINKMTLTLIFTWTVLWREYYITEVSSNKTRRVEFLNRNLKMKQN